MRFICTLTFSLALLLCCTSPALIAQKITWQQLDHGLEYAAIPASKPVIAADGIIRVVRIDPAFYDFQLIAASEHGRKAKTGREWCESQNLLAVVNAGMFLQDGLTNVGFMKNYSHLNHAKFNNDNTLVAFNPENDSLPGFKIIDRTCDNWEVLVDQYQSVSQGIRMVDCKQSNKWSQQDRIWSMVVIAMDKQGRALFIFCRSPYSVHDFIDMLLQLPLQIYNAMYLEGGPEATLFLKTDDCEIDMYGSYETGFYESDGNDQPWPIPNVIGIRKK